MHVVVLTRAHVKKEIFIRTLFRLIADYYSTLLTACTHLLSIRRSKSVRTQHGIRRGGALKGQ